MCERDAGEGGGGRQGVGLVRGAYKPQYAACSAVGRSAQTDLSPDTITNDSFLQNK